jgi:hypothetical protein
VKDKRVTSIGVNEAVFGAAAKVRDMSASQSLPEIHWKRAPKIRPARFNRTDLAALENAGQASDSGFNFR